MSLSSNSSTVHSVPTIATAPFEDVLADVVLRTSDQVDFHVFRVVLRLASPLFRDMFSLRHPPPQCDGPGADHIVSSNGVPIPLVSVTEDSETIDYLLRLCYPIQDPETPTELSVVAKYLQAALKYQLEEATDILKKCFRAHIPESSLKVYAMSCRLKLEEEASLAAHSWRIAWQALENRLKEPDPLNGAQCPPFTTSMEGASYVDDMKFISAGCYQRLLDFMRLGNSSPQDLRFCDLAKGSAGVSHEEESAIPSTPSGVIPPELLALCPPDIALKCSDGTVIETHRTILQLAAGEVLNQELHTDKSKDVRVTYPYVEMQEDNITVAALLRLCYPHSEGAVSGLSVEQWHRVYVAAQKYKITSAASVAKKDILRQLFSIPHKAYLVALQYGWKKEAKEAAKEFMCSAHDCCYIPEMELSSADVLYELLRLKHMHVESLAAAAQRHQVGPSVTASVMSSFSSTRKLPMIASFFVQPVFDGARSYVYTMKKSNDSGSKRHYSNYPFPSVASLIERSEAFTSDMADTLDQVRGRSTHIQHSD